MTAIEKEPTRESGTQAGFTLMEALIALLVLTYGLLAAGQLMLVAMGSASLSRSKSNASVVAQSRIDLLADLYRQDPASSDLTLGAHGPVQVELINPLNSKTLNRYNVAWTVSTVSDPRPGKSLSARAVTVTVTPINAAGATSSRVLFNKIVTMTTVLSPRSS
jgi:Tfp pilus assembly protein PilV